MTKNQIMYIRREGLHGISTVNQINTCCQCDGCATEANPLYYMQADVDLGKRIVKPGTMVFTIHRTCLHMLANSLNSTNV
jgi:hypothetical protein